MLNFYVRHGIVIDKIHDIISIQQSKWLEKYLNYSTQKGSQSVYDNEKDFNKLLNNAFLKKIMESVRNRCTIDFI